MEERKVSMMVFYDKKKRILLQGRKNISKRGEEWGFFGGGIEKGETPEQALKREIKEELDYELEEFKFFKMDEPRIYGNLRVTCYVFTAPLPDISRFRQSEGDSMKLFAIRDAKKLKLVEGDYRILNALESRL